MQFGNAAAVRALKMIEGAIRIDLQFGIEQKEIRGDGHVGIRMRETILLRAPDVR